jgi:transposase
VVLAVSEQDGELEQAVETTADLVGCPVCGAVAQLHDRRLSWVRDLPTGGRPVTVVWVKRVWRCPHAWCPTRTWTETSSVIAAWSLTERARAEICRRVGEGGTSVAAVAREFGIGWRTAMTAVREHGKPRVDDPARLADIDTLGMDETAFRPPARAGDEFRDRHRGFDPPTRSGPATRHRRRSQRISAGQLDQRA